MAAAQASAVSGTDLWFPCRRYCLAVVGREVPYHCRRAAAHDQLVADVLLDGGKPRSRA